MMIDVNFMLLKNNMRLRSELGVFIKRFKKFIFSLLIIFLVLISGRSRQVIVDRQNSKLLNYNFRIVNVKNIDKTLSRQRYGYSTNIDNKYFTVATYKSKNASMKQYLVNKNGYPECEELLYELGENWPREYSEDSPIGCRHKFVNDELTKEQISEIKKFVLPQAIIRDSVGI